MLSSRDCINEILACQKVGTTVKLKDKAKFRTRLISELKYNGQVVDVIAFTKGKDIYNDRYTVKFNDGTINDNIMSFELNFDYEKIRKNNKNKNERSR